MTITGNFITEPPDTITQAFTFKVEVSRSSTGSETGGTVKFRAVLLDGNNNAEVRIWSVNTFLAQGQSKEINLNLAESRALDIAEGDYTLAVQTANYPLGDDWTTLVSKNVTIADDVDGVNGGSGVPDQGGIGTNQLLLLAGVGVLGFTLVSR